MGLVIVALSARFGGYDALADPAGWLLVVLGLRRIPDLERRREQIVVAVLALAVSCVVWWPATSTWLDGQHPSLRWALTLPQLGFQVLLAHVLAARAKAAGDSAAARWLRQVLVAVVVVGLLPVLVFATGSGQLEVWSYVAAALVAIWVVWLLFVCAPRPWARGPEPPR
jgi:hypothetical protein